MKCHEREGEFGIIVPRGIQSEADQETPWGGVSLPNGRLIEACENANLPTVARKALNLLADQLVDTQKKIADLTADIRTEASANDAAQRLQAIPGVGPITASAFVASLWDISDFKSSRDLSAWIGLRSVSRTDRVPARTTETTFIRRERTLGEDFDPSRDIASCQRHACSVTQCPAGQ